MFSEGFRDKIFDTKTVAALQHALADQSSIVRTKVVKFLIAAIAQGVLQYVRGIFVPNRLQRAFGT